MWSRQHLQLLPLEDLSSQGHFYLREHQQFPGTGVLRAQFAGTGAGQEVLGGKGVRIKRGRKEFSNLRLGYGGRKITIDLGKSSFHRILRKVGEDLGPIGDPEG